LFRHAAEQKNRLRPKRCISSPQPVNLTLDIPFINSLYKQTSLLSVFVLLSPPNIMPKAIL
jgi:hypothetical protein